MWELPLTSHLDGTAFASPAPATAPEQFPVTVTQAFIPPASHSATPSQNELSIPGVGFDASKRLKETQRDSKRLQKTDWQLTDQKSPYYHTSILLSIKVAGGLTAAPAPSTRCHKRVLIVAALREMLSPPPPLPPSPPPLPPPPS